MVSSIRFRDVSKFLVFYSSTFIIFAIFYMAIAGILLWVFHLLAMFVYFWVLMVHWLCLGVFLKDKNNLCPESFFFFLISAFALNLFFYIIDMPSRLFWLIWVIWFLLPPSSTFYFWLWEGTGTYTGPCFPLHGCSVNMFSTVLSLCTGMVSSFAFLRT